MKFNLAFAVAGLWIVAGRESGARAQGLPWPKNEYGQIVFEGGQAVTGAAATRRQAQPRILAWFSRYFADGRAVESGKLSARGEFNGWGTMPALTVGPHSYRFRMGVGAQLHPDSLSYRIGEIQCILEQQGKQQVVPLEKLVQKPSAEQQQALVAFRRQLEEFIKSF